MTNVNSWNEWDPLEEVIVGSARGAADIGFEPSLAPYFPPGSQGRAFRGRPVDPSVVDDAERQLDAFAKLLDRMGVTVRRPDPVQQNNFVKTPDWEIAVGRASACPRDVLLVIGDEIIEGSHGSTRQVLRVSCLPEFDQGVLQARSTLDDGAQTANV